MRLVAGGRTIDNPTDADIALAVPRGALPAGWDIELIGPGGLSIEAEADAAGALRLAYVENRRIHDADRPVGRDELVDILRRFRAGDPAWRSCRRWTAWSSGRARPRRTIAVLAFALSLAGAAAAAVLVLRG